MFLIQIIKIKNPIDNNNFTIKSIGLNIFMKLNRKTTLFLYLYTQSAFILSMSSSVVIAGLPPGAITAAAPTVVLR